MTPRPAIRTGRFALVAVVVAVLATVTVACDVAVAGRRCTGGIARDRDHVLVCRDGRWRKSITLAEAGRIIGEKLHADAQAAAPTTTAPTPQPQPAGGDDPTPTTAPPTTAPSTTTTTAAPAPATQTIIAAGDLAQCNGTDDERVADLIRSLDVPFLALGDQNQGSDPDLEYPTCYDPVFGEFFDRTFPVAGNHEYMNGSPPRAYLSYFGSRARPNGTTWYSYEVGNWHVVALNSNCEQRDVGGCGTTSAQYRWLAADLAASTKQCLLAYWHHSPFYSVAPYVEQTQLVPMMQLLHGEGLDVLLGGHLHNYERFARMNPNGTPDPTGFRAFVVGTGGFSHFAQSTPRPGSEVRNDTAYGVLRLDLAATGFSWKFLPAGTARFTDSGADTC